MVEPLSASQALTGPPESLETAANGDKQCFIPLFEVPPLQIAVEADLDVYFFQKNLAF